MVWFEATRYRKEGSTSALLVGVVCVAIAVALAWYLKNLRRFVKLDR